MAATSEPSPPWPSLDLALRARLGRFEVVAKLGQGGMADVFLAVARGPDTDFHKVVVLKRLRFSFRGDPDVERMFLEEARIAARLSHPNVVHTYSIDSDDGHQLLVMEYLEGVSLGALFGRLADAPFADRLTLMGAVSDALAGLQYFHEFTDYDQTPMELVHRDIKPDNILVTFDGQVKLVDFGIAKAMAADGDPTASVVVKGTARYMAPEMVGRAREIDRRADLFAIGVILWEFASGKRLWEGVDGLQILKRLADNEVPSIESETDELPDELARICGRALQTDPKERYPTAAALKRDLDAFLESCDASPWTQRLREVAVDQFGKIRSDRARAILARLDDIVSEYSESEIVPAPSTATDPAAQEATALVARRPTQWWRRRSSMALAGLTGVGVAAALYVSMRATPSDAPTPAALRVAPAAAPEPADPPPLVAKPDPVVPAAPKHSVVTVDDADDADTADEPPTAVEAEMKRPQRRAKPPRRPRDAPEKNDGGSGAAKDNTGKKKGLALDHEAPWGNQ